MMFQHQYLHQISAVLRPLSLCLLLGGCFGGGGDDGAAAPAGGSGGSQFVSANGYAVKDSMSVEEAARFLNQATFGATEAEIDRLVALGYSAWFKQELAKPMAPVVNDMLAREAAGQEMSHEDATEAFWRAAIQGNDQLRQRMAFALSQIMVISYNGGDEIGGKPLGIAAYMDLLGRNAFGSYRTLLEDVTYSPMMAIYLTYLQNRKANPDKGTVPDENYAREVMQLFSIGLVELNQDGSPKLDSGNNVIETYATSDVTEMAKVFTGLSYKGTGFLNGFAPDADYSRLQMFEEHHSPEAKSFLGITVPANTSGTNTIALALDRLATHDNTAPFIGRQLIQRFVTSNPPPAYITRVADAFVNGRYVLPNGESVGDGTRGNLTATLAAVLFDPEARDPQNVSAPTFGKVREPVIRFTHWARAFGVNSTVVDQRSVMKDTASPDRLAQQAYRSPSVFNFYRPGYAPPGSETGAANLVAPELQITHETSVIGYANFMRDFVNETRTDRSFVPDYGDEIALAEQPDQLVAYLNLVLTGGAMHDATRARIRDAVASINVRANNQQEDRLRRVQAAVLLATTSTDFTVQR